LRKRCRDVIATVSSRVVSESRTGIQEVAMSNRVSPPSRLFPIAFAVLAAATAGALLTPAAHAAAQALSVLVTNTDAIRIPATLVGPASVSIAGTPSVSLAGTPSVAIASDGRAPVQAAKVFFGSPDTFDCGQIYQVPAGKRLVVQYVGVEAFGLTPTNKVAVRLNASSEAAQLNIPIARTTVSHHGCASHRCRRGSTMGADGSCRGEPAPDGIRDKYARAGHSHGSHRDALGRDRGHAHCRHRGDVIHHIVQDGREPIQGSKVISTTV
jgi:hypothetical protein